MAGEVGHVVYAARLLTHLGDRVQDPLYWVGTLFPDIRHLGIVSRQRTHPSGVSLASLVGATDFHTGLRVHAWVDATREKFFRDQHMKEHLPWHPFVPFCLNLLEDELLYEHFEDWNLLHRLLNQVHTDELHFINERFFIERWHTILQAYFQDAPSNASRQALTRGIGLSTRAAEESEHVLQLLTEDGRAKKLLERFWQHLEDVLR